MAAAEPTLRIELLGGFRVIVGNESVPAAAWRRSKAAGLVKLLALAPGHRLHREQAMDVLWPELAATAAAANLRKAVHYARHAIHAEGASLIASVGESLSLPTDGLWVDVDAWRTATGHARRSGDPSVYADALELYREGLLPEDRFEEWTGPYRDELQSELVAVLGELAVAPDTGPIVSCRSSTASSEATPSRSSIASAASATSARTSAVTSTGPPRPVSARLT